VLYALKSETHNSKCSAVSHSGVVIIKGVLKQASVVVIYVYKFSLYKFRISCSDTRAAAFFQFCKLQLLIMGIHILQYSINAPWNVLVFPCDGTLAC